MSAYRICFTFPSSGLPVCNAPALAGYAGYPAYPAPVYWPPVSLAPPGSSQTSMYFASVMLRPTGSPGVWYIPGAMRSWAKRFAEACLIFFVMLILGYWESPRLFRDNVTKIFAFSVSLPPFPPFFARPNRHHQIQQRWKAHGCAPSAPSLNAAPEAFLRPFCRSPQSDWPTELRRYHVYPEP